MSSTYTDMKGQWWVWNKAFGDWWLPCRLLWGCKNKKFGCVQMVHNLNFNGSSSSYKLSCTFSPWRDSGKV